MPSYFSWIIFFCISWLQLAYQPSSHVMLLCSKFWIGFNLRIKSCCVILLQIGFEQRMLRRKIISFSKLLRPHTFIIDRLVRVCVSFSFLFLFYFVLVFCSFNFTISVLPICVSVSHLVSLILFFSVNMCFLLLSLIHFLPLSIVRFFSIYSSIFFNGSLFPYFCNFLSVFQFLALVCFILSFSFSLFHCFFLFVNLFL